MVVSRLLVFPIQNNLSELIFLREVLSVRPRPHNLVGGYMRKVDESRPSGHSGRSFSDLQCVMRCNYRYLPVLYSGQSRRRLLK